MRASWKAKVAAVWEAAQIELNGYYSTHRVLALAAYASHTSLSRAVLVSAVTPLPCLVITTIVDLPHLRPVSEGLQANQLFVARAVVAFWVAGMLVTHQLRHSVPSLPLSNAQIVGNNLVTAILTVSVWYALALAIGFPVPFGIVTVSPAWVAFLLLPIAKWLHKVRSDPEAWPLVVNSLKVWACQELLVVIYPTYFYLFTVVPTAAKSSFALLLPVIKLVLRNVVSQTIVHLHDEIPEVVILNVEVFNALFVSYCMQNSPSLWTTCGLMAVDAMQMSLSLRDVGLVVERLKVLRRQVASTSSRQLIGGPSVSRTDECHIKTLIELAQEILGRWGRSRILPTSLSSRKVSPLVPQIPSSGSKQTEERPAAQLGRSHRLLRPPAISAGFSGPRSSLAELELQYVRELRRVLYITEFVVLLNYVEVVIPLIFCRRCTLPLATSTGKAAGSSH
ncbi:hypothetical protein BBJ28_00023609 [Nothophytophthora sp. Chile5]|nr:hypothetical protein BBJ28_00023609 [Nothophytophthora sp. Chile5]